MKKILLMTLLSGILISCGGVELTPLEKKQEIAKKAIFEGDKEAKKELDKILQELKEKADSGKAREELKEWKEVMSKESARKALGIGKYQKVKF